MIIQNFHDAERVLRAFVPTPYDVREVYTLNTITALMNYLGNPQESLKVVHVAGTSGKTSTAYYAASLLHQAGKKVGLSVSPHIDTINERVQVGLVPLSEKTFCAELESFIKLVQESGLSPTYFELLVAFAYWEFARQEVDYAVIEVGLGGLLDGTNVVNRADKLCIITDIGLDHVRVLGGTLSEIATQKAGIIKNGNDVFCYEQSSEVMEVMKRTAKERGANLIILREQPLLQGVAELPLFQQRNFSLAHAAIAYLAKRDGFAAPAAEKLTQAMRVHVPGRMETVHIKHKTVIIDGAHNKQKMHALRLSIQEKYPGQKAAVLASFASSSGERLPGLIEELTLFAASLTLTTFSGGLQDSVKHSLDTAAVMEECKRQGYEGSVGVIEEVEEAIASLLESDSDLLVITGSLYLIGHVHAILKNLPEDD